MNSGFINKLKKKKITFDKLRDEKNYFEILRRLISYNLPRGLIYLGGSDLLRLEIDGLQIKKEPNNCLVRQATLDDLDEILTLVEEPPLPVREKLFRGYFNDGHECYALITDDQIIGYLWAFSNSYSMTYDDYVNTLININIECGSICLGDALINPSYRGRGLYPFLMKEISNKKRVVGTKKLYAFIGSHNEHSLNIHRGFGFVNYMSFRYFTVFNIKLLSIYKIKSLQRYLRIGKKSFYNTITCEIDKS